MRMDDLACESLRDIKPIIMSALPGALDTFYGQVAQRPETRAFFSGSSHMGSAKRRQIDHWETISSGRFDDGYVSAVTTVGETHARIGLEPRWYIGGYALVLEALIASVTAARWPRGGVLRRGPSPEKVAAELGALAKATLLDMDYAI